MKRKVLISIIFAAVMACALIFVSLAATSIDAQVHLSSGHVIDDFTGVFYLPASQDLTKVKVVFSENKSYTYGNGLQPDADGCIDITPFAHVNNEHTVRYSVKFTVDGATKLYTFYAANSLPTVYIESSMTINEIKVSRKVDEYAKVQIVNPDGSVEYADSDLVTSEFKVRGNTTPDLFKKPYQIKIGTKTDLFGMGEGKTWVLLANYLDTSLLRTSIMFELAQKLGMDASDFQSVDVYVNGCYEGVYLLCEKINVEPNRVDIRDLEKEMNALNNKYPSSSRVRITSGDFLNNSYVAEYSCYSNVITPVDITGGYLIELDNSRGEELIKSDNDECYFKTDSGNYYVIKSPEICSQAQMEYISGLFSEMEEAIYSSNGYNSKGKHYSEYMDIDSFAYAYIMCEFGRTYDAGSNSVYFYKDADKNGEVSKFVKGPLWDCDNSLANIERGGAHLTNNLWAATRTPWNKLTQHADFNALVAEKYEGIYDTICDMVDVGGFLDQKIKELGSSVAMDRLRNHVANKNLWPIHTYKDAVPDHLFASSANKQWFNQNSIAESQWAFRVFKIYSNGLDNDSSTVIGNLRTHISARANWLADYFNCDVTKRTRVDHVFDDNNDYICNDCGSARLTEEHVGGRATCKELAKCDICGLEYGEFGSHSGGTATCTELAKCDICGLGYGEVLSHSGGTATCTELAKCDMCGLAYGQLLPHSGGTATDTEYAICDMCGLPYGDLIQHSGGTATCTELAICEICGLRYGSLLPHSGGTATCTELAKCDTCGLGYGEVLPHSGGTATCTELATCDTCGLKYGELLPHDVAESWHSDDSKHWHKCNSCNHIEAESEHTFSDEWTVVKEATKKEEGVRSCACTVCGATKTEAIPKLAGGCGGGNGVSAAFISCGGITALWFTFKRKIFHH